MASSHRKMLFPYQPVTNFTFTFCIPCLQTYPPPPPPPPPPHRDLSGLVTTSICVMGFILLVLFLTVFLFLYITKSRRSSPATMPPGGTNRREDENEAGERSFFGDHHVWSVTNVGLHRSAIDSITVVGFKKGEGVIDSTDCSVCLNEFEEDETLRLLPKCSHAFHINCIDTWLLSNKNCPLCRAPIFPPKPRNQKTKTNHQSESGSSNGEEESSGSRHANVLPRVQSDLSSHCGSRSLETVRRSFSIEGSSSVKAGESDDIATRSGRHFYSSFSANFSSSRNQDSVLPSKPSVSG